MGGLSGISAIDNINPANSQGTVGKAVAPVVKYGTDFVDSGVKIVKTPFEIATDVARGDIQNAEKNLNKGAGSALYLASGVLAPIYTSDIGQKFLSDKNVDRYTLGLSGDIAGTYRGGNDLRAKGETTRENWDDAIRFGGKVATIGGAAYGYEAYQSAASVGGSAIPGYLEGASTAAGYAKDAALYGTAATALSKGDVKGAYQTLQGADTSWLPQLPNAPDWVPDFSGLLDDLMGGSGGTTETNPWKSGGTSTGITPQKASAGLIVLAGFGLVAYMLVKKKVI